MTDEIGYNEYASRISEEGIDKAIEAFKTQQQITGEMQDKKMFGEWDGTVGAAELSAYTALVIYKDLLLRAMHDEMSKLEEAPEDDNAVESS